MPAFTPVTYLAQAASVVGWSFVVIVFVVAGFAIISWLRKWMKEDDIPSGGAGFGLGELRRMHARGELSDEEFERARGKMTASAKAITANMPDPAGGRRAPGAPARPDPGGSDANRTRPSP
ncbi:MAG: SHOCT domain-containing protein [Planctomycetota bacterium]|nr:SHOCT domain-containing protein [Planctomycetota bacterium]